VPHLVEVAFKGNRKEFFLWEGEEPLAPRAHVVVEADRGEDLGQVYSVGDLAQLRARGCTHGTHEGESTPAIVRPASPEDRLRASELRASEETTRREAMSIVRAHSLPMKLTDAEWRWDRRKLTIYFTADHRVDFRALVRDLASRFRARIELKQIGVRDEARRLSGIGRCGREYCSASWMPELRPVNLGLAKDQKLSLNPTQISGACGRLMCCLRHEHDWYVETRRRFPKEGKVVTTAQGEEKVVMNDLFRERVTLRRLADGDVRIIPLAQLNNELHGTPVETDEATDLALPLEAWSEELLSMTDTVERPIPSMLRPPRPSERPVPIARAPQTAHASSAVKTPADTPGDAERSPASEPSGEEMNAGAQAGGSRRRRRRHRRGKQNPSNES
jgi:cell fate regulator YaaT (PSP1 superfamily)